MNLRGALRAIAAVVVLEVSWLVAVELVRSRWPGVFLLSLLVGWPLAVAAWSSLVPPKWGARVAVGLSLPAADLLLDGWWRLSGASRISAPRLEIARILFLALAMWLAARLPASRPRRIAELAVRGVTVAIALLSAGLVLFIALTGPRDHSGPADAALILGYPLDAQGKAQPSLVARVNRGARLLESGRVPLLVVSGGAPVTGRSEASVMRELLERRGISATQVAIEDRAATTDQSFACGLPILARHGAHRVLVVTEPWHMPRALLEGRRHLKAGMTLEPAPASSPAWRDLRSASHLVWSEAMAYLVVRVRGLSHAPARCPPPRPPATP